MNSDIVTQLRVQVQDIIRTANQEGLGRAYAQTFLFLWAKGENTLRCSQCDLANETGVLQRTIRAHLYALQDAGWIEYEFPHRVTRGEKEITLKRFKH